MRGKLLLGLATGLAVSACAAGSPSGIPKTVTSTVTSYVATPSVGPTPTAAEPVATPTLASQNSTIPGEGVFQIGSEVTPGTYRTNGPADDGGTCGWVTHSRMGASSGDQVDGNSSSGQLYAEIPSSGAASFETYGCQTWQKVG